MSSDLTPMSADEAVACEQNIQHHAEQLASHLMGMKERKGYLALGFENWTAYLESGRLKVSRSHVYRILSAADVSVSHDETLPLAHSTALAKFPREHQETVYVAAKTAAKAQGKSTPTAKQIERIGETIVQAATTGYVDDHHGNPISISIQAVESESRKRQLQHIDDSRSDEDHAAWILSKINGYGANVARIVHERLTAQLYRRTA